MITLIDSFLVRVYNPTIHKLPLQIYPVSPIMYILSPALFILSDLLVVVPHVINLFNPTADISGESYHVHTVARTIYTV